MDTAPTTTTTPATAAATSDTAKGRGLGVRQWPFVSLNMRPHHLAEWSRLALQAGRSRADLLREALEQVGLPYARSVAKTGTRRPEVDADKTTEAAA